MDKQSKAFDDFKNYVDVYIERREIELFTNVAPIRANQLKKFDQKKVKQIIAMDSAKKKNLAIRKHFIMPVLSLEDKYNEMFPINKDEMMSFVKNNRIDRGLLTTNISKKHNSLIDKVVEESQALTRTSLIMANNRRIRSLSNKFANSYKNMTVNSIISDANYTMDIRKDFEVISKLSKNNIQSVESTISKEIENDELWVYEGPVTSNGTKTKSIRPFCQNRAGRDFTETEVDSWNEQSWEGKIHFEDVWLVCGGYNCRHSIIAKAIEEDLTTTAEHTPEDYEEYKEFVKENELIVKDKTPVKIYEATGTTESTKIDNWYKDPKNKDDVKIIHSYTSKEYDPILKKLRNMDKLKENIVFNADEIIKIKELQKALAKHPYRVNGEVYRGLGWTDEKEFDKFVKKYSRALKNDRIVTEYGFFSTSYDKERAKKYASNKGENTFKVNMIVDAKGRQGIFIGENSSIKDDREILFNLNPKFKVNNIKQISETEYTIYIEEE